MFVDLEENLYEQIPIDDASDISCVSTFGFRHLSFWRSKDKSFQSWIKEDEKWQAGDKIYWNDDENVYSVKIDSFTFKLLPLIKEPDNDTLTEVFVLI